MEVGIVLALTVIVVAVKGLTTYWVGQLASQVRELESDEVDVLQKLEAVEATKLQLEREKEALEREKKLLENERELVALDIQKMGVEPLPESSVDEMEAAQTPGSGAVAVESRQDEGTPDPAEDGPPPGVAKKGACRVLVVDDNEELRGLLEQLLSKTCRVTGAEDGYEALTKIVKEKQQYDVVVTDLKMPNVNGVVLMQSLPKDVPVIVISGFLDREEFRNAMRELTPFEAFQKPFKTSELLSAIQRAAASRNPEEQAKGDSGAGQAAEEGPEGVADDVSVSGQEGPA